MSNRKKTLGSKSLVSPLDDVLLRPYIPLWAVKLVRPWPSPVAIFVLLMWRAGGLRYEDVRVGSHLGIAVDGIPLFGFQVISAFLRPRFRGGSIDAGTTC